MWPYIKAFFTDEHAFQRGLGILAMAGGSFLARGAVIPGTDRVIDALAGPNLVNLGYLLSSVIGPAILAGNLPGSTPKS